MRKLFLFGAIALLLATVGCGDDEKKVEQEAKLSIIGTWKCIGFGTTDNNKIKEIEPKDCAECYTITFKEDGKFNGHSSTNEVFGKYNYNLSTHNFAFLSWGGTKINELIDGPLYVESMSKVTNFNFSKEGELLLYYNNKKEFLIFKSI